MKYFILVFFALCGLLPAQEKANPFTTIAGSQVLDVCATGSMKPAFDENYWLLVKKLDFKQIRVGDVIIINLEKPIFTNIDNIPHFVICHRVIRKSSDGSILVSKGDNNNNEDNFLITEHMYGGTVVGIVRKGDV